MDCMKRRSQAGQYPVMDCRSWGFDKSEAVVQTIIIFLMTGSLSVLLLPQVQSFGFNFPCCAGRNECGAILTVRFSFVYILFLSISSIVERFKMVRTSPNVCSGFARALIIVSGSYASLYISPLTFDQSWMRVLLFGGMTFIPMQIYVLLRLSYVVIIKLHRMAEGGSELANLLQIVLFVFTVITPIFGEVLLIYYYPLCGLNLVFVLTNAAIPFVACLWSTSDCVKAANGYTSFARGGIFACFIIFYTWSAIGSHPEPRCNPYFFNKEIIIFMKCVYVVSAHIVYIIAVFFSYHIYIEEFEESPSTEEESERNVHLKPKRIIREEIVHVYNPQFSSFVSMSMVCYVVISLLNWSPSDVSDSVEESRAVMWFKLVGCWFSVLFFVITLYTPSLYGIFPRKTLLRKP